MSIIENRTLERYEFKYFLSSYICDEIINHVKNFMSLDQYAAKFPNKNYLVRSIYFEDDFNSNFDEKINGFRIRKKFRLRFYNTNLNKDPIYLEIKGRNLERTYKRRVKIDQNDLKALEQNRPLNMLLSKYPDSQIIKFVFEYYKKKIKPKVLIDYTRKPFVNNYGLYFRLTFDQNISCINLSNNLKNTSINQKIICKAGLSILEVKFERSIPLWFHRIIQTYNLRRESISKFVLGMCYTNLGEETSD